MPSHTIHKHYIFLKVVFNDLLIKYVEHCATPKKSNLIFLQGLSGAIMLLYAYKNMVSVLPVLNLGSASKILSYIQSLWVLWSQSEWYKSQRW